MGSKKDLKAALAEANQRAQRLARDNDAFRERERVRMVSDHNAKQAKLKQAERDEKRKRIETIDSGAIPMHYVVDATCTRTQFATEVEVKLVGPQGELEAIYGKLAEMRRYPRDTYGVFGRAYLNGVI